MRTRTRKGEYTPHNTPGDGTGKTHFPPHSPYSILKDAGPDTPTSKESTGTRKRKERGK